MKKFIAAAVIALALCASTSRAQNLNQIIVDHTRAYQQAVAVVTSDSVDLANITKAIYVGVSGDVKVDMERGGTVTLKAAPVGFLKIAAKRIYATGTTATNLIAFF